MSATPPSPAESCALEPIRVPGSVQPYGALLVVDPDSMLCLHASDNLGTFIGAALSPGAGLRGRADLGDFVAPLCAFAEASEPTFFRACTAPNGTLLVAGARSAQGVFFEFERPSHPQVSLEALSPRIGWFLDAITSAATIEDVARAAVSEIRALTGFDRALLYSFDENGDGAVLAEDRNDALPSYLGLRFPASDIPAQARELYRLNRIRLIADANYTPCPVRPATSPLDGRPLDLSCASLRSVSPVHLEYMRNMGTGASVSLSILVNGQLWGLLSAHNATPRHVDMQARIVCDTMSRVLSLQIEARERARRTAERLALKRSESRLLDKVASADSLGAALVENAEAWLALVGAQGAAALINGEAFCAGLTPSEQEIRRIGAALLEGGETFFSTDCLSEHWPPTAEFAHVTSGLLATSISHIRPDYLMWFRPEVVRTIVWSGDPTKAFDAAADRLHPRKSFEAWSERVSLRSERWSDAELESAADFRNAIQSLVLRRAEERAELTERLEYTNRELEAFSYSVSHDLRAPFRHIVGYAELLADRERALDETSKHFLDTIKDAAISAGRLVDDLLAFSQLGRVQFSRTQVDMNKLVAESRRALETEIGKRNIDWRIANLPPAFGDAGMIRQVLTNLLQNAVKYTSRRADAKISISSEDRTSETSYAIADNGVGFDMAYSGKLFGVFQRLHRTEEFEGTGIGLALSKRIVERHNGVISARGVVGEGATFTFTLPKRPNPNQERS